MSVYTDKGYESRREYLTELAEDYCIDKETVFMIADTLGSSEDFDGLINAIEDHLSDIGAQEDAGGWDFI